MTQPLHGIKVLDFSMGVAGPHAGMLLAQHGAEVVKIETREGDWTRVMGRRVGDLSAFSVVYNQGKRGLAIDLKSPLGREAARRMACQADVLIEAFRPGVMDRFGLGWGDLQPLNPRLVYLSVSGFGAQGPRASKPGTDLVLQAYTGLMHGNRDDSGLPRHIDFQLIDAVTGLYAYHAIAGALFDIARNGAAGRHLDCSLMAGALAYQSAKIAEAHLEGDVRPDYVPLGVFATADGHVALSTRRDDHFVLFCSAVGRADLAQSGLYTTTAMRVARKAELVPQLREAMRGLTTAELTRRLDEAGILNSVVNSYETMLQDEHVKATQAVAWRGFDGFDAPLPICRPPGATLEAEIAPPPHIGEHSVQVLRDWGVDDAAIERLLEAGAVFEPGRGV